MVQRLSKFITSLVIHLYYLFWIEWNGRWKLLHYYAKNFFAPLLVSPFLTYDSDPNYQVGLEIVSDLLIGYKGPLTVRVFRTDNNTAPVFEKVYNASVVSHPHIQIIH